MRPKKVLIILQEYPQISETYIAAELNALWDRYEIHVLVLNLPNLKYRRHRPFTCIPTTHADELRAHIRRVAPDIVHGHYLSLSPIISGAARFLGVPFTVRAHSFDVLGESDAKLAKFATLINAEAGLGVLTFPYTRPRLERAGVRAEKIHECYPLVDFDRFHDESPNGDAVMNIGACLPKKQMEDYLLLAKKLPEKRFNLYALGYGVDPIRDLNRSLGSPVALVDPVQPEDMLPEYKKHEWLVYTASRRLNSVGWPVAVAEAQAAGVGVCMQNIRPDLREYVGEAGFVFDTIDEAVRLVSRPFPEDLRTLGFEQARKSDVKGHIHRLERLWAEAN